jgi:Tol biopolymer transport system component
MRSKDGLLTFPTLLSDGKTLVFVTNRTIRTRDLETGNERTLYQISPKGDQIAFCVGANIGREIWALENFLPAGR